MALVFPLTRGPSEHDEEDDHHHTHRAMELGLKKIHSATPSLNGYEVLEVGETSMSHSVQGDGPPERGDPHIDTANQDSGAAGRRGVGKFMLFMGGFFGAQAASQTLSAIPNTNWVTETDSNGEVVLLVDKGPLVRLRGHFHNEVSPLNIIMFCYPGVRATFTGAGIRLSVCRLDAYSGRFFSGKTCDSAVSSPPAWCL